MREKLCPPSPATVRGGKQQILRRERGGGRRDLGGFPLSGGILHPSPLFPRSLRRKKKKKITPRYPELVRPSPAPEWPPASAGSRLPSLSLPFPPPREAAPARPGPSPPLRPQRRESTKEGGPVRCRGGRAGGPTRPHAARAPPLLSPRRFRGRGYSWVSRGGVPT